MHQTQNTAEADGNATSVAGIFGNNKCQPHGEATGNVRGSLKTHHLE